MPTAPRFRLDEAAPPSPEALVRRAKALLVRRRADEAAQMLRRALALDPFLEDAPILLCKALVAGKHLDKARELLGRLLYRHEAQEAYGLLVRVCLALEDWDKALEVAGEALQRFPSDARLQALGDRARREAAVRARAGEFDDARGVAGQGATRGEDDADAEEWPTVPRNGQGRSPDRAPASDTLVSAAERAAAVEEWEDSISGIWEEARSQSGAWVRGKGPVPTPELSKDEERELLVSAGMVAEEADATEVTPRDELEEPPPLPPEEELRLEPGPGSLASWSTVAYGPLFGPGASSVSEAVERFVAAANPLPTTGPQPLFSRLLGDGPPLSPRAPLSREASAAPAPPLPPPVSRPAGRPLGSNGGGALPATGPVRPPMTGPLSRPVTATIPPPLPTTLPLPGLVVPPARAASAARKPTEESAPFVSLDDLIDDASVPILTPTPVKRGGRGSTPPPDDLVDEPSVPTLKRGKPAPQSETEEVSLSTVLDAERLALLVDEDASQPTVAGRTSSVRRTGKKKRRSSTKKGTKPGRAGEAREVSEEDASQPTVARPKAQRRENEQPTVMRPDRRAEERRKAERRHGERRTTERRHPEFDAWEHDSHPTPPEMPSARLLHIVSREPTRDDLPLLRSEDSPTSRGLGGRRRAGRGATPASRLEERGTIVPFRTAARSEAEPLPPLALPASIAESLDRLLADASSPGTPAEERPTALRTALASRRTPPEVEAIDLTPTGFGRAEPTRDLTAPRRGEVPETGPQPPAPPQPAKGRAASARPASARAASAPPAQVPETGPQPKWQRTGPRTGPQASVATPALVPAAVGSARSAAVAVPQTGPQPQAAAGTRGGTIRTSLRRSWPLWVAMAVIVLSGGAVAGLWARKHQRVEDALQLAREWASRPQVAALRTALQHARAAADLGGRKAKVVALAAAIRAELAVELGETEASSARALIDEGRQLGGRQDPVAAEDLAVAEAYLAQPQEAVAQRLAHLATAVQRFGASRRLRLLLASAQLQSGDLDGARQTLERLSETDPRMLKLRAQLLWRTGLPGEARAALRRAAQHGLSMPQLELELFRFRLEEGTLEDANLPRLRRLAEEPTLSSSERAWARLLSAQVERLAGRTPAGRHALGVALRERPLADSEFDYWAAELLKAFGRFEEADRQIEQARRLSPLDERMLVLQAEIDLALDRVSAAVSRLASLMQPSARARLVLAEAHLRHGSLARAREALQLLPKDGSIRQAALAGRILLAEGKAQQALQEMAALNRQHPGAAEVLLVRGLAALAVGELRAAEYALGAALIKEPLNAEALWGLARVKIQQGEGAMARAHLERAVAINGHWGRLRIELGHLLVALGDFAAARPQFAAVLARDPENLSALAGRARSSIELGLKEAPADLEALRASGHRNMGTLLSARYAMVLGQWERAGQELRRLGDRWLDDDWEARLWYAEVLQRQGKDALAAAFYRDLREDRRARPAAELGLSELRLKRDQVRDATAQAQAALEAYDRTIAPTELRARIGLQLARCYRRGRGVGAAIAELQEVLEALPKHYQVNFELGQLYLSLHKRWRAVPYLAAALAARPASRPARAALVQACHELRGGHPECKRAL
ncbi:MAG: tetratricopeptide repeat protein [Deltaproteobacteria bacterium]|nr:tetratricopeptide repeat protein [Deltaproteobacteria bacterium]